MARKGDFLTLEQMVRGSDKALRAARRTLDVLQVSTTTRKRGNANVVKEVSKVVRSTTKLARAIEKAVKPKAVKTSSTRKDGKNGKKNTAGKKTAQVGATRRAATARVGAVKSTAKAQSARVVARKPKASRATFKRSTAETRRKARRTFTKDVIANVPLSDRILDSKRASKQMLDTVQSTISRANRRIRALQKEGVTSSALKRVMAESGRDYFDFNENLNPSNRMDWDYLKDEYSRAVGFLNTPTSSVRGAKQYIQWYADKNGIDEETAERIIDMATSTDIDANGLVKIMDYSSLLKSFSEQVVNGNIDYSKLNAQEYGRLAETRLKRAMNKIAKQMSERGTLAEYDL